VTPVQARIHHGLHCHHLGFHHNLAALFAARPDCFALLQDLAAPTATPTWNMLFGVAISPPIPAVLGEQLNLQAQQNQQQYSSYAAEPPLAPVFNSMPPAGQARRTAFSLVWQVWGAGFGGSSLLRADPATGNPDTKSTAYGGIIGLNYLLAPETLIGISLTQSQSNFSSSDEYESSSGRQNGTAVSLSWTQLFGPYYAAGNVGYTYFSNTSQRIVTGEEIINASYASNQFTAGLEVGRPFVMSKVSLTPFVGVQFTRLWQPTYTETSIDLSDGLPGVMGQTYQANTITSLPTSLGVQFDTRVPIGGTLLAPYVRVAWLHNLSSVPNTTVISTINVVSSLEGTAGPTDSALVNAGAMLSLGSNVTLFGKFTGQFADSLQTYAGTGGLRIAW
jgi:outer membrane autotransporter protein